MTHEPAQSQPIGYLPPPLADWLRRVLVSVTDPQTRSEIAAVCETAWADGHAAGHNRGYGDGSADEAARRRLQSPEPVPAHAVGDDSAFGRLDQWQPTPDGR